MFEFLKKNIKVSETYKKICHEVNVDPRQQIFKARLAFFSTFLVTLFLFIINQQLFPLLALPFISYIVVEELPKFKYRKLLLEELNEVPIFFGQLVMLLKRNPNLEVALQELAKGEGRLNKLISKQLWALTTGKKSAKKILEEISSRYEIEEMRFGVYTILSSFNAKNREELLDKGLDTIIEGIRKKIDELMGSMVTPILFLFSFATTIPMLLITLIPILSILMHLEISIFLIAAVLAFSLIAIWLYIKYIETNYPDFLPKARFKFSGNPFISLGPLFLSIIFFILVGGMYGYLAISIGITLSILLLIYIGYAKGEKALEKQLQLEQDSINKLYQMALQIEEGRPVENVINYLPSGPFTDLMKKVIERIKKYHVSLGEAVAMISKDVRGNLRIILSSIERLARKGASMAETLKLASEHLHTVAEIREEVKRKVSNLTQMMQITGMVFVPIVGAMVITFYRMILEGLKLASEFFATVKIGVDQLTLVVSLYSFLLSIILLNFGYKFDVKRYTKTVMGSIVSIFIFVITLIISYSLA